MSSTMRLGDLLAGCVDVGPLADTLVRGLSLDSRAIAAGDAYIALRGGREHGIVYAADALRAGAVVVLAESGAAQTGAAIDERVVWIDGLRAQLGRIAARFYGDASSSLRVSGVTGTNGKTSTVQLLGQALNHLGRRAATIGTLGAGFPGSIDAGERTTPDVISVQRLLARFLGQGATDVAMEVSSHALEQGRVDKVHFRLAVFTNLSRDHLDYHGSMEAYGAAKQRCSDCRAWAPPWSISTMRSAAASLLHCRPGSRTSVSPSMITPQMCGPAKSRPTHSDCVSICIRHGARAASSRDCSVVSMLPICSPWLPASAHWVTIMQRSTLLSACSSRSAAA